MPPLLILPAGKPRQCQHSSFFQWQDSPVIVTSQRSGLPEPPRHSNGIRILTAAPAPEPDMTSRAVLDAQPKSEPEALAKIHPEARAARAEAPSERDYQKEHYQRNEVIDR